MAVFSAAIIAHHKKRKCLAAFVINELLNDGKKRSRLRLRMLACSIMLYKSSGAFKRARLCRVSLQWSRNKGKVEWLSSRSLTSFKHRYTRLDLSENTIILFVCPPKFCKSIAFVFSWDHCKSQEKLETMLMQNLGGQTKSIMVFSEVAYSTLCHKYISYLLLGLSRMLHVWA